MLDYEGNMQEQRYQKKHILDMPSISVATAKDHAHVDTVIASSFLAMKIDEDLDELASMGQRDEYSFAAKLSEKVEQSKFSMSIGSVSVGKVPCDLFKIDEPHFMEFGDLVNDYLPHISAAHASKPKTMSKDVEYGSGAVCPPVGTAQGEQGHTAYYYLGAVYQIPLYQAKGHRWLAMKPQRKTVTAFGYSKRSVGSC